VDKDDYYRVIAQSGTTLQGPELLMRACKMGAARELFEETGMDYRSTPDRYIYMKRNILFIYIICSRYEKYIIVVCSCFFYEFKILPHTHTHTLLLPHETNLVCTKIATN